MTRKLTNMQKFRLFLGFVTPFISIGLAMAAYLSWATKIEYFNGVADNWLKGPVVEFQVLGNCPQSSGWSEFEQVSSLSYVHPYCDCKNSDTYNSHDNVCTAAERNPNLGNCTDTTRSATESIRNWRFGLRLCAQRADPNTHNAMKRIRAPGAQECPAGYHKCGEEDCMELSYPCPFTEWVLQRASAPRDPKFNVTVPYPNPDNPTDDYIIALARGTGRPFADLKITDGKPSDDKYLVADTITTVELVDSNNLRAKLTNKGVNVNSMTDTWTVSSRPEILWKAECPEGRDSLVDVRSKVNVIRDVQLALMVIAIVLAAINLVLTCAEYRDRTDDSPDNDEESAQRKNKCNIYVSLLQLPAVIVAVVMSFLTRSVFSAIKDGECSDAETNAVFSDLADKIIELSGINLAKLVLTTLFLMYKIYKTWFKPDPEDRPSKHHTQAVEVNPDPIRMHPY